MLRKVAVILLSINVLLILLVVLIINLNAEETQLFEETNYLLAQNGSIPETVCPEGIYQDLYQVAFPVAAVAYTADDSDLYYYEAEDRGAANNRNLSEGVNNRDLSKVVSNRDSSELTNLRYLALSNENESRTREEIVEHLSEVMGEEDSSESEIPLWRTLPYLIYVSLESFTIAILGLDDDGYHTRLVHTFHTAFGRTNAQTRPGTYEILSKSTWIAWRNGLFSPYGSRYVGNLWFHGPLYSRRNLNTMRANTFNEIGTRATAGCFRTYTYAAAWIYYNAPIGTRVIVANDSFFTSPVPERVDRRQTFDPTFPLYMEPSVEIPIIEYEANGRCG